MCYLNNGPKIQKDQSLRQSVSCEYHMNEDKSNRIKKKKRCWGRRKSEGTNHNNNQPLYLEIFLLCMIVKKYAFQPSLTSRHKSYIIVTRLPHYVAIP